MSNEIKMSDVFPKAFEVEHNKSFSVQNCHWVTFGEDFHSNCEQDSAIEIAVLSHDQHVARIAELEDMLIRTYSSVRKDYKNGTLDSDLNWSVYSSELNKLLEQSK